MDYRGYSNTELERLIYSQPDDTDAQAEAARRMGYFEELEEEVADLEKALDEALEALDTAESNAGELRNQLREADLVPIV